MTSQFVSYRLNENQTLVIKAFGQLTILGWDDPEVAFTYHKYNQKVESSDRELRVTCFDDCVFKVPQSARVYLEKSLSKVTVSEFEGQLEVRSILGSVALLGVKNFTAEKINGSCYLQDINGDMQFARVNGQLKANGISGSLSIGRLNGMLDISGFSGSLKARIEGDCRIGLATSENNAIDLRSSHHVTIYTPEDFKATYDLKSGDESISLFTDDLNLRHKERRFESQDENSTNAIKIDAAGKIEIKAQPDYNVEPVSKVSEKMFDLKRDLESLIKENVQNFEVRVLEEAYRGLESAFRRDKPAAVASRYARPVSAVKPTPKENHETETLLILKMVQDGKITPSQAEVLLNAIDKSAA